MQKDKQKQLENLCVEMVLAIRNGYVASRKGRVKPDYWDRIQDMIRVGTGTTTTLSEWANSVQRDLQIQGLDKYGSSTLVELVNFVDEHSTQLDAIDFIEHNAPLLIALARKTIETRKQQDTAQEVRPFSAESLEAAAKEAGIWEGA